MSIDFNDKVKAKAREMLRKALGTGDLPELVVIDEHKALFAGKQPVAIKLNDAGEVEEMLDGTRYRATTYGWEKVAE